MELSNLFVRLQGRTKSTDANQRYSGDECRNGRKPSGVNLGTKPATEQRLVDRLELPEVERRAEKCDSEEFEHERCFC